MVNYYGDDKPTAEAQKTINDFFNLMRYARSYTKWWKTRIDNMLLGTVLTCVYSSTLRKYKKELLSNLNNKDFE